MKLFSLFALLFCANFNTTILSNEKEIKTYFPEGMFQGLDINEYPILKIKDKIIFIGNELANQKEQLTNLCSERYYIHKRKNEVENTLVRFKQRLTDFLKETHLAAQFRSELLDHTEKSIKSKITKQENLLKKTTKELENNMLECKKAYKIIKTLNLVTRLCNPLKK